MLEVHEPDGNHRNFTYDAMVNVVHAKDLYHDVRFEYCGLGKLKARVEGGRRVEFAYDTEEQLHTIRNEKGHAYRFELDPLGNVVTEVGFDKLTRRYVRDPVGQVTQIQRPAQKGAGQAAEPRFTRFHYDAAGNVQTVHHHDGSKQSYAYNEDHQLIRATNGQGNTLHSAVTFTRNAAGQVLKEEQQFGGKTYTVSSEFDACRFNLTFLTI